MHEEIPSMFILKHLLITIGAIPTNNLLKIAAKLRSDGS